MTRSEEVHSKGFDLFGSTYSLQDVEDPLAYRKIKVGPKSLDDAIAVLENEKSGSSPSEAGKLTDDEWAKQMERIIQNKKRSN